MILKINDRIRVRKLDFFTNYEIHMKYDSLGSAFKFDFVFDPKNPEHKELGCISHYHIATLERNGKTLMTGYITDQEHVDEAVDGLVSIQGYSLPGVLQDCELPYGKPTSWLDASAGYAKKVINKIWPGMLEYNGLNLKEIVERCLNPFDLTLKIDESVSSLMNQAYDEMEAKEKQTVKSFICELAAQKNIIVTDDELGRVVFTKPRAGQKPIFHFEGNIPNVKMTLRWNGRGVHSHIRVVQQQDMEDEIPGSERTIQNPYVFTVFRPHVVIQNSGEASDTEQAAKNVRARELKALTLTIEMDRWQLGDVTARPGQIISITNPKVYLYNKTNFFIEEVVLRGNAESETATLTCVPPEVYTGAEPNYPFKGINLH